MRLHIGSWALKSLTVLVWSSYLTLYLLALFAFTVWYPSSSPCLRGTRSPERLWMSHLWDIQEWVGWNPDLIRFSSWHLCPWQEGWNWMVFEFPFNLSHSMILWWFCNSVILWWYYDSVLLGHSSCFQGYLCSSELGYSCCKALCYLSICGFTGRRRLSQWFISF